MAARIFLAGLIAASLVFCTAGCSADPYADEVSREDLRVMRALVDISCKLEVEKVVISDRPAIPREGEAGDSARRVASWRSELARRPAHEARWPVGQICSAVRVVAEGRITQALENETGFPGSWRNFKSTFGGSRTLMRISLPVYSPDGKHAVVYTEGSCPYTCGAGFYHELEKTHKGWKILTSVNAWTA